jgi:phosphoribosylformylglycinamidine synthase
MALAGSLGANLSGTSVPQKMSRAAWYFGEEQGRYIVTLPKGEQFDIIHRTLNPANSPRYFIGTVGGDAVEGPNFSVKLADLRAAHEGFFPKLMGSELTPEF